MLDWIYYLLLSAILIAGVALNLISMPGNWLMLIAMVAYDWATGWRQMHWSWLMVMLAIAGVAEAVEFFAAGRGAKQAGGSFWGTVGALIGALLGGFFLTWIIPVPIVGTVFGILLGTFLGAALAEMLVGQSAGRSTLIGFGAAKGRLYGTILKFISGCILLVIGIVAALPLRGSALRAPPSTPTTVPVPARPLSLLVPCRLQDNGDL